MTGWVPDYSLDAPDGHTWMKPAPGACPNCACCTDHLCNLAGRRELPCWQLTDGGLDVVGMVAGCPCSRAAELRRLDLIRAEVLADVDRDLATGQVPVVELIDEHTTPAGYGDDPHRVYLLVTCNPECDRVKAARAVCAAANASGIGRQPAHAWTHGMVLLESAPTVVDDLLQLLVQVTAPSVIGDGEVPAVVTTHQLTADQGRQVLTMNAAAAARHQIRGNQG